MQRSMRLLDALTAYNRPVYLRLGYGFNDPANKYAPDVYMSAWKKFHERIQAKGSTNVALVWQSASSVESHPLQIGIQAMSLWIGLEQITVSVRMRSSSLGVSITSQ